MQTSNRNFSALENAQLVKRAPSVFAHAAHSRTSERYTQIPTINVVDALRGEGWMPVWAAESRVRVEDRKGFAKHMLRFRHRDDIQVFGTRDRFPEIVMVNAHDGSASYQLHAGIFRLVCENGMIVADTTMEKQCIRHTGDIIGNVIEGVYEIVEGLPEVAAKVENFRSLTLDRHEEMALGKAALALKWEGEAPITAERLTKPRRMADTPSDLWTVFNRVQENMLKGGLRGMSVNANGRLTRTTTREVKSVNENVRLNKALWTLADEMAKLKS